MTVLRRLILTGLTLLALGVLAGAGVLAWLYQTTTIPEVKDDAVVQSNLLRFADGSEMLRLGDFNRTSIPLEQVSATVQNAVLATEDRNFYTEHGISVSGTLRAVFTNVREGGVSQGGSTLTQQYVKNTYLSSERTLDRKLREAMLAIKIDRTISKHDILQGYLNTVYFGRGAYGVQAASRTWFGVDAAKLDWSQGALLAGLLAGPAYFDPERHPDQARDRWTHVVGALVDAKYLTRTQAARLKFPKTLPARTTSRLSGPRGFIAAQVRNEMESLGFGEAFDKGGLTVVTTIDRKAQRAAERAVASVLTTPKIDPLVSLVSVQPGDGAIRAYYGGRDYTGTGEAAQVDTAQVHRQPGSTFKPYALAAALADGIPLSRRYTANSPMDIPGYPKPVHNYNDRSYGRISLLTATKNSVNTAYLQMTKDVGPQKVADVAHALGVKSHLAEKGQDTARLGIALGIYEVTPLEQATGYATLANDGVYAAPYLIAEIHDVDGTLLYKASPNPVPAVSSEVANDVSYALQQTIKSGTGVGQRLEGGRPAAGKTGTTEDHADAWFAGFTPQLATAVWMGYPVPTKKLNNVHGVAVVTGGSLPGAIWKKYMDAAHDGLPVLPMTDAPVVGREQAPAEQPDWGAPPPDAQVPTPEAPTPATTSASPSTSQTTSASPSPTASSAKPSPKPAPTSPSATASPTGTRPTKPSPSPSKR